MKRLLSYVALVLLSLGSSQIANAGEVSRAQFTSAIDQREPVDEITILSNNINKIYFFSELRNLQGEIVTHRWLFADKVMAEVSFRVEGPRWRVNSSKTLLPGWVGDWSVAVVDGSDTTIAKYDLQYIEAE